MRSGLILITTSEVFGWTFRRYWVSHETLKAINYKHGSNSLKKLRNPSETFQNGRKKKQAFHWMKVDVAAMKVDVAEVKVDVSKNRFFTKLHITVRNPLKQCESI